MLGPADYMVTCFKARYSPSKHSKSCFFLVQMCLTLLSRPPEYQYDCEWVNVEFWRFTVVQLKDQDREREVSMEVPTIDNKSRKSAYLRIVDTLASPSLEYYQLENHLGPKNLAPKA